MRPRRETNDGIHKDKDEKEGPNVFVAPIGLHSRRPLPSVLERINKRRNINAKPVQQIIQRFVYCGRLLF